MCIGIFLDCLSSVVLVGVDAPILEAQSGLENPVRSVPGQVDNTNTALVFAEGLPGMTTQIMPWRDDTYDGTHNESIGLHDILSRPIRISSTLWSLGSNVEFGLDVLYEILNNPRVTNRINNFSYINGTVNVRVVVTGVPQHYGMGIVSLDPWARLDSHFLDKAGMLNTTLNQMVQLPHIYFDASTSTAGELSLPLMLPFNALALDDEQSIKDCVSMRVKSFTPLATVASNAQGVHIAVWAWMTDVMLSNPTSVNLPYLDAQSGDEYGKAPVSKSAGVVASIANFMTAIPIISPYARATEMVAKGVAGLAELFGYSRPTLCRAEMPLQNKAIGNLSHYNFEDSATKLTLDSKNEVTIDPRVVGVDLKDEMSIVNIATREGYLGSFTWNQTNFINTPLARMQVTPSLCGTVTSTGLAPVVSDLIDMTPAAFAALSCTEWRGTMKFRFVVVCSAFHKGRLRFVFEPRSVLPILGTPAWISETNINQSYVLDLSSSKELIIKVPWASHRPYLRVTTPTVGNRFDFNNPQTLALETDRTAYNGLLGAHVLTPLTAPGDGDPVRVLVFVSACDDFEIQEPGNLLTSLTFSGWEPQSGTEKNGDLGADILTGNEMVMDPGADVGHDILGTQYKSQNEKFALIHYGERIVSVRQLIKRYVMHTVLKITPGGGTNETRMIRWTCCDFPSYKGYDLDARTSSTTGKYNFARDSYLSYYAQAYLGYRGSVRQKYVISHPAGRVREAYVSRTQLAEEGLASDLLLTTTTDSAAATIVTNQYDSRFGATGVTAALNNCVEAETPYYSPCRFKFAMSRSRFIVIPTDDGRLDNNYHMLSMVVDATSTPLQAFVTRYVAAGDDMQFVFFKYAPVCRIRGTPTPV